MSKKLLNTEQSLVPSYNQTSEDSVGHSVSNRNMSTVSDKGNYSFKTTHKDIDNDLYYSKGNLLTPKNRNNYVEFTDEHNDSYKKKKLKIKKRKYNVNDHF